VRPADADVHARAVLFWFQGPSLCADSWRRNLACAVPWRSTTRCWRRSPPAYSPAENTACRGFRHQTPSSLPPPSSFWRIHRAAPEDLRHLRFKTLAAPGTAPGSHPPAPPDRRIYSRYPPSAVISRFCWSWRSLALIANNLASYGIGSSASPACWCRTPRGARAFTTRFGAGIRRVPRAASPRFVPNGVEKFCAVRPELATYSIIDSLRWYRGVLS